MKKKISLLIILAALSMSLVGCGDPCKDDAFTRLGDSLATMGKKDLEKNQILAERAAKRGSACAEKKAAEMKKGLGL